MSFIKIAWSEHAIIDSFIDEPKINENSEDSKKAALQFRDTVAAAKKSFAASANPAIKKSPDFLYVRTRAIGSLEKWGPNLNGDGFPFKELEASYTSFVGKGNFLDHKSDDIRMIRGLVIDAYLNREDQCVECLIAVDKVSHPQLARHIETGVINSVSMGTRVGFSNCSVCNNVARTENDYCTHVAGYKGMKFGPFVNNAAHRFGQWPVHEVNHDLEFIELSWVSVPAFREANVLERIASLKEAVVDEQKEKKISAEEREMVAFATSFYKNRMQVTHTQMADKTSPVAKKEDLEIPASLKGISERAQCLDANECALDPRKAKQEGKMTTKTAAGMQRIKITVDEISFRKGYNDFTAEGTVTINEKEYEWWASSSDKKLWTVNLDEDAASLISAKGNSQIIDAVEQLLTKNLNDTELIIAKLSGEYMVKSAYLQGGEDELMTTPLDERAEKHGDKPIYNNKDLEVPSGVPVRETELDAYSQTAKEGPAGALGKTHEITENTSPEEEERKLKLQRAYLIYQIHERKNGQIGTK